LIHLIPTYKFTKEQKSVSPKVGYQNQRKKAILVWRILTENGKRETAAQKANIWSHVKCHATLLAKPKTVFLNRLPKNATKPAVKVTKRKGAQVGSNTKATPKRVRVNLNPNIVILWWSCFTWTNIGGILVESISFSVTFYAGLITYHKVWK